MTSLEKLFKKLQTDAKSMLFTEETINEKMLKKLKKSTYVRHKEFVNLSVNSVDSSEDDEKKSLPINTVFVEKKDDIDRSTLYSFDGPFQLLHADVGNLEFLGKSAADQKYCLLFVDLFTSKVYVYSLRSRKSIAAKMESVYNEVQGKRKGLKTRLQTDLELKQKKIFELNRRYNVKLSTTAIRGRKTFAAEQKLRESKKIIFRLKALEIGTSVT